MLIVVALTAVIVSLVGAAPNATSTASELHIARLRTPCRGSMPVGRPRPITRSVPAAVGGRQRHSIGKEFLRLIDRLRRLSVIADNLQNQYVS